MELDAGHFPGFFEAVHGYPPFPWQAALVERLAREDAWPDVLNLPTSAGKTAALDAAVFHLALRAGEPRRAALRICLVVDRRLVVDDAHARASRIAAAVAEPARVADGPGRAIVAAVSERLARLAEAPGRPLVVQRLRGGVPLEREWARTPTQPTILCSTVDQVGSRLLFRGYGVSDRMRPVHAGLLGQHTLVLVDEAHLSRPFLQTLRAVRDFGGAATGIALLSATPGGDVGSEFVLSAADRGNAVLRRRLQAKKPATLVETGKADDPADVLCRNATAILAEFSRAQVVGAAVAVVVNRVQLAREVHELLRGEEGFRTILLIGRCRSIERDRIVARELAPFKTGEGRGAATPLVVVATQCIEVGVDLDLDGLITQAAPLDALRQRFGRLNRDGRDVPARAAIVATPTDLDRKRPDPVYGDRVWRTWEALRGIAVDDVVDFGIEAMEAVEGIDAEELAAPSADAPVLMPEYLDLWAQTWPAPASDPDVNLFLHGKDAGSADVSLVWRADVVAEELEEPARTEALALLFSAVPPRAAEAVTVPAWAARSFLEGGARSPSEVADLADREAETPAAGDGGRNVAFRWAGRDDPRTGPVTGADVRAGDVLVLPSTRGGCDAFGWHPANTAAVSDVADLAAEEVGGAHLAVRVSRDLVGTQASWTRITHALALGEPRRMPQALVEHLLEALAEAAGDEEADSDATRRDVGEILRNLAGPLTVHHYPDGLWSHGGAILVGRRRRASGAETGVEAPSTEDDDRSHAAAGNVSLELHSRDVAGRAEDFVRRLGMEAVLSDVALAAYLHDAGKADPRFQAMLAGGDDWNMPDDEPLAKSSRGSADAWRRAGLPARWRHEAQSVRMCRDLPRLAEAKDPELVLWLVGTHHGLGRPFFGFAETRESAEPIACLGTASWPSADVGPQSLAFRFRGRSWPDLFAALQRRYGIWGLAHLEAIVRLADHRASEARG